MEQVFFGEMECYKMAIFDRAKGEYRSAKQGDFIYELGKEYGHKFEDIERNWWYINKEDSWHLFYAVKTFEGLLEQWEKFHILALDVISWSCEYEWVVLKCKVFGKIEIYAEDHVCATHIVAIEEVKNFGALSTRPLTEEEIDLFQSYEGSRYTRLSQVVWP